MSVASVLPVRLGFLLLFHSVCNGVLPAVAAAQPATTIAGRVLGYNGVPLEMAHVFYLRDGNLDSLTDVKVDSEGNFRFSTTEFGRVWFWCTGVNHITNEVTLMAPEPPEASDKSPMISVTVRMKPSAFRTQFDSVVVIGDFNEFEFSGGIEMEQGADGLFHADVPAPADTLGYQLTGITQLWRNRELAVNGTDADRYYYDGGGAYVSVVDAPSGTAHITFNPALLPEANPPLHVTVADTSGVFGLFVQAFLQMNGRQERYSDAYTAFREAGGAKQDFTFDWGKEGLALERAVKRERDPERRALLLLAYVDLPGHTPNPVVARQALAEIPATSLLWSARPPWIFDALWDAGYGYGDLYYMARTDTIIAAYPKESIRVYALEQMMYRALGAGDSAAFRRYYGALADRYPTSPAAVRARKMYSPERKVVAGNEIPPFAFTPVQEGQPAITRESMHGKYYLLDFWATWCGPCIRELPELHKAYQRYMEKNFTIISINYDSRPEFVADFRANRFPMPWLHAAANQGLNGPLAEQFEIAGIPRLILVDTRGAIIATDAELRGERLMETLERLLGERR